MFVPFFTWMQAYLQQKYESGLASYIIHACLFNFGTLCQIAPPIGYPNSLSHQPVY